MASLLFHRLLECAKAIEGGNVDVADSLLAEIQSLASKEESIWTRKVVKYFAEALVRRAYGIRPPCPLPSLPLLFPPIHYMYELFYQFAKITNKHVLADALNSGNKRLHVIDFSIVFGFPQWNSLIKELKEQYGGLQSVLITSIAPKLSKHSAYLRQNREWARKVEGKNFELRQLICNSPEDIVNCISKLRRQRKGEMVVVNWYFTLHKLLAQDGAMEQVLSKVKDLGADIMVIVEQEANLNSPDLSERLEQSFQHYSPFFESLEEDYHRNVLWEMYFRRQIGNVVACEGVDRVERIESFAQWQNRLSQAGFCPVPQKANKFDEEIVIEEKEGHNILLRRSGCPLAVASVWKVTDPPQFSGGLYTMQDTVEDSEGMDTVDDSEGMASSSESEDDEEKDSLVCIMADRNLWSTQGSSMNRIAASAKLYDILEYICDLHRLPLAVTWISYGQDGNTNSKGKRILRIDDSACYVNNWSMGKFVDEYARHHLEEGQGIAGRALQSNIHIQHDISVLDPAEFPHASNLSIWHNRNFHAVFAIRLTSTTLPG
uniref:NLP1-9 GAF domain-containing protein n=1 Tax=Populus trichocarpa TaxID=3694 RepID=A0A3N7HPP8_POPTR